MTKKRWSELTELEKHKAVKGYKTKTGKEVAKSVDAEYSAVRSALSRHAPKTTRGGARAGAGMKKGTILCKNCRKKNCICE